MRYVVQVVHFLFGCLFHIYCCCVSCRLYVLLQVTWDPYVDIRPDGVVHPMAFYSGTLKYMDIVEPYHPERFLRQLGHVQGIPDPPYRPSEALRGKNVMKYKAKYAFVPENWERWRNHLLSPEVRGEKSIFPFLATPQYLPWFLNVSHPLVDNPAYSVHGLVVADDDLMEVCVC